MSCSGPCRESPSKSDLDKWTSDLGQMISSDFARREFSQFLENRRLTQALSTLKFIIQCEDILLLIHRDKSTRTRIPRFLVLKSLNDLLEAAEDVDFYENQINELKEVLNEKDNEKIYGIVNKAKTSALSLLEEEHKEFSKFLIKEYSCKR